MKLEYFFRIITQDQSETRAGILSPTYHFRNTFSRTIEIAFSSSSTYSFNYIPFLKRIYSEISLPDSYHSAPSVCRRSVVRQHSVTVTTIHVSALTSDTLCWEERVFWGVHLQWDRAFIDLSCI